MEEERKKRSDFSDDSAQKQPDNKVAKRNFWFSCVMNKYFQDFEILYEDIVRAYHYYGSTRRCQCYPRSYVRTFK